MPCLLVFDVFSQGEKTPMCIPLDATELQAAMKEAKIKYRTVREMFGPVQMNPRLVSGNRTISLRVSPTQIQRFSLQM
ncbi:hypothetical protein A3C09_04555 [Candidatus Uhrbacteria bacterium RIFCSPHIGHO2_02_FULL_47_44]|uniref:Uncharacterized protein n=1 Tax=Candidatus Uhrbacteria bacterium RIFCSPLOWO2_02_FULL_48_18 TaxID=1802408 RepID=A0A1F7VCQ2_9BACT|nr:MAG: hypothetical protein A2839_04405 [Candidatus Uhrbacteria bacterium RIFCSPHIGHO2_01_FULL_47_10]OGL71904.1 MAG: hypothetical protein A3C09_04555 [Candidatus Uhrbacteria bacterium RIFCSPHIGHO2_02_FULL_47_44]OGL88289.1 MAG: hypothetical protein A3I41_01035 [Candidatus Uhrbacteria bacterium RIFCSPLOWO2_02_FULL_48_18]